MHVVADLVALAFLQVASPVEPSVQPQAAPAEEADAKEEPKVVCTMEPITGTRAAKMRVCKTPAYAKVTERAQDMIRGITNGGGDIQPKLPPRQGATPGFPGY